ncbi:MAG TPA: GNAT family N-acetyltransferase [Blastocatellia bacterium]|nr:GNAT family N-acetyltransferase [Blastocatellia bacterium]
MDVVLRPATPDDLIFARAIYYETQRWVIEHYFGWNEANENEKFLNNFNAEKAQIIVIDSMNAGWLQVFEDDANIEVGGIYISNQFQNRGAGTLLLTWIMNDAESKRKTVTLSTAKINPARRLYERLGFRPVREDERKIYMQKDF